MDEQQRLELAMRIAVDKGLFPKYADEECYLRNWNGMKAFIVEFLDKLEDAGAIEVKR